MVCTTNYINHLLWAPLLVYLEMSQRLCSSPAGSSPAFAVAKFTVCVLGPLLAVGLHLTGLLDASQHTSTAAAAWPRQLSSSGSSSGSGSSSDGSSSGSSAHGSSSGHAGHHGPPAPILASFGTLAAGAFILFAMKNFGIPYTVILLTEGMLLGALLVYGEGAIENPYDLRISSLAVWANLDAHLMLNIFLPPLIFESAFATEFSVFYQCMWYCLFLAVPCMLCATYATGALANFLLMPRDELGGYLPLPYSMNGGLNTTGGATGVCAPNAWSEEAGYTLGVVLSATDPVAVVALLKDLGLSGLLPVGIEGESLLNDGTALVLFQIFLDTIKKAQDFCGSEDLPCDVFSNGLGYVPSDHWLTPVQVVWKFSYGALMAIFFGIAMGLTLTTWMSTVYNDAMVEVSLTLTFAYLTFYIAENILSSSGVLAVVSLGMWMSRNGRTQISTGVEEFLMEFWEMLSYFGNTLIFVITGIIFVYDLLKESESPVDLAQDLPHLLIIYVGCLLIRWALVTIAYAVFNLTGWLKMEWKWSLISTWGGLRGAVGLGLGMLVFKEDSAICANVRMLPHPLAPPYFRRPPVC